MRAPHACGSDAPRLVCVHRRLDLGPPLTAPLQPLLRTSQNARFMSSCSQTELGAAPDAPRVQVCSSAVRTRPRSPSGDLSSLRNALLAFWGVPMPMPMPCPCPCLCLSYRSVPFCAHETARGCSSCAWGVLGRLPGGSAAAGMVIMAIYACRGHIGPHARPAIRRVLASVPIGPACHHASSPESGHCPPRSARARAQSARVMNCDSVFYTTRSICHATQPNDA